MPAINKGKTMRITRTDLNRTWLWSSIAAIAVFAVLVTLDRKLAALSGLGTADLQYFWTAGQFQITHLAWAQPPYALRAGFNLGLDYLFMPLYAASFFCSGVILRESLAPRPGRLRRILMLLALVPVAGAVLDAIENGLEIWLVLGRATDNLARIASAVSNAKNAAVIVGLVLLLGAIAARGVTFVRPRQPAS